MKNKYITAFPPVEGWDTLRQRVNFPSRSNEFIFSTGISQKGPAGSGIKAS
jgi:hypothetical protein